MYYGMKLISPKILVPLAFVLSGLTAEFTGTSFGSVATMGIALVGVASTTSIPVPLVIAAVVCGAWFGDKMSPLSDTTNLASGVSRVPLYDTSVHDVHHYSRCTGGAGAVYRRRPDA